MPSSTDEVCAHIVPTLEHLKERVSGCSLVERRYLRLGNVTMMDFSTTCIEVLCEKCHVVFFFWVMMFLRIAI